MIIKKMELKHIPMVAEIEKKSFSKPWSEQSITDSFNAKANYFFVAEDNQIIVGYIGLTVSVDEGYILNVAVLPQYRGKGIGDRLVKNTVDFGNSLGLKLLTLEVRPSNISAVNLYQKYSFKEVGIRKNYYSNPQEDALLLTKFYNSYEE